MNEHLSVAEADQPQHRAALLARSGLRPVNDEAKSGDDVIVLYRDTRWQARWHDGLGCFVTNDMQILRGVEYWTPIKLRPHAPCFARVPGKGGDASGVGE